MALATGQWRSLWSDGGSAAWQAIGLLVLSGVIGIFVGDTALFACMNRLGPRRSGLLFATHSLFTVVLAALFLDESLKGWAVPGGVLLVGGVMGAIALGRREGAAHPLEGHAGPAGCGRGVGAAVGPGAVGGHAGAQARNGCGAGLGGCFGRADDGGLCLPCAAVVYRAADGAGAVCPAVARPGLHLASAALAMAVGMTLILKALQHGSAGLVGMLSSDVAGAVAAAAVVAHRATPCLGLLGRCRHGGGGVRADLGVTRLLQVWQMQG